MGRLQAGSRNQEKGDENGLKDYMIQKREAQGLTVREMARKCECSFLLLDGLECEDFKYTHPNIAARIANAYGFSVPEYNKIVHKDHRVSQIPKPKAKPRRCNINLTVNRSHNGYKGMEGR